ncbi:MAG: extracellular solute-binding protein [Clostridiales bacterium]|nr:extracellular solute-binding protein [Clostridiales bacterium]
MKEIKKKLVCVLMSAVFAASACGCGLNKDAKEMTDAYVLALISMNTDELNSRSAPGTGGESFASYEGDEWKSEYVRHILQAGRASIDTENSSATKSRGGVIRYTLTIPNIAETETSGITDLESLDAALYSSPTIEIPLAINVVFMNGEWLVSNSATINEQVYGRLYGEDLSMFYPEANSVTAVRALYLPEDTLTYRDVMAITFDVEFNPSYIATGRTPSLEAVITDADGEEIYRGAVEQFSDTASSVRFAVSGQATTAAITYFPQGSYELSVYNNGVFCGMCEFATEISDGIFSDEDILDYTEWSNADSVGGYYNVDNISAILHMNRDYLYSGKPFSVTFDVARDGETIAESQTAVFNGSEIVCTYSSASNLDTGLYTMTFYNNGTWVDENEIMVTHNFNETAYTELEVATNVTDEIPEDDRDHVVTVYALQTADKQILNTYSDVEISTTTPAMNTYRQVLDAVLASGDNAPDVILCDASLAQYYADSPYTLPINDLGISYDELRYMYEYTFRLGTSYEGVIKGITWEICPGAVFYNRDCAEATLGVREPEDVQRYFETWDAFLDTARAVNEVSGGTRHIVSGVTDIQNAYMGGRPDLWTDSENVYVSDYMSSYFDLARALTSEELTFGSTRFSQEWNGHMNDRRTLSYWGTLWLGDLFIANSYSGKWGVVHSPVNYYDGGTWMFATTYNDMRASTAQLFRDVTMDSDNLLEMASHGKLVNAINIMTACAEDDSFARNYLDGQNPYGIFADTAWQMNVDSAGDYDSEIDALFLDVLYDYANGEISTVERARSSFISAVEDAGIL